MLSRISLIVLLLFTIAFSQTAGIYRLNDIVGDTIDILERTQYNLFPNVDNFELAYILKPNDSLFYAVVIDDSLKSLMFKLAPWQIKRLAYCISNAETIEKQIANDEFARLAYEKFWDDMEPIAVIESEGFTTKPSTKTREGRVAGIIYGSTIGTAIGGYLGSQWAIKQIRPGGWQYVGTCDWIIPIPYGYYYPPTYHVNHPLFWTTAILGTTIGTTAGYLIGNLDDNRKTLLQKQLDEKKDWRICCAIISCFPATYVGALTFVQLASTHFGTTEPYWYTMENDPKDYTTIPALLVGIGVSTIIVHLSYELGKVIDHNKAVKAAKNKIQSK